MTRVLKPLARRVRAAIAAPTLTSARDPWAMHIVQVLSLGLTVGLAIAILHNSFVGRWQAALALAAELVLVRLVAAANRRGHSAAGARLLAASLPLLATALMLTGYGMRDVASLILPASLVVCGLLIDGKTLAGVAVLTMLCIAVVIAAESQDLLLAWPGPFPYLRQVLDAMVIVGLTAMGVGLVSEHLRRSYALLLRDEAALRTSEERYRSLIDLAADAIYTCAADGTILEANRRASELSEHPAGELIGRHAASLYEPLGLSSTAREQLAGGETVVEERELRRRDGTTVRVEVSFKRMPDGNYQCIVRDVSERRRAEAERLALEARLRQSQKMEAIGRLAGGVAHDFNNLLTAITGSLTLAMRDVPPEARAHRWLCEVENAAWRAAGLTRQLLAFSRKQAVAPQIVDLRTVVDGVRPMLARLIGEDIELQVALAGVPCVAEVDQGQLEQMLLNLAANARDAMPDGGVLSLEVALTTVDEGYARAHPDARPGRYVALVVSDAGHGMTEDVRSRVFEPFFTTKPAGSGTGLGLSMVYGAVQQNRGFIEVESAPGRGTTFRIFLPEVRDAPAVASRTDEDDRALRGAETILLVEDEAPVREVTTVQLDALGYRVLACPTGEAALATARAHQGPLDLLVTDLVMPGMSGQELARRMAEAWPSLKVLFTSGYGEDVAGRQGALDPGAHFLEKPYTLQALARRVRETLAG